MNRAPLLRNLLQNLLPAAILAAPSLWLLAVAPPFWRDIDAYNQVTLPPGPLTILQFSPLYCFGARVPLYLGWIYEAQAGRGNFPTLAFFQSPVLTNLGVLLLIALQHIVLLAAQWLLLRSIVATNVTKLVLALLLALNAPFYTYTHCVGTEALSLSFTLFVVAAVLRIAGRRHVKKSDWFWFGLSLTLSILLRHINAVVAALLPTIFLAQAATRTGQAFIRSKRRRFPWRTVKRRLVFCGLSLAVALLSLAVADRTVRYACRAAKIKDRSTIGLIFEWRLNFLAKLDAKERADLLGRLAQGTPDPVVQRMILETPAAIAGPGKWNPQACTNRFVEVIEQSGVTTDLAYHLDLYRNRLAQVFLRSFEPAFLRAVRADFRSAFDFSLREVTTFPIAATSYWFGRIDEMPQLKNLAPFRGSAAEAALNAQERLIYFRLIDVRLRSLLIVWAALTIVVAVLRKGRSTVIYSAVLVGVGIVVVLLTCFLSELLPRFLLPFWALFVPAVVVSTGSLLGTRAPHGT
ncbi:MAG TPA: hypothetical protein VH252_06915 [Chthoniobacterales bacterium]|nr:hypothetical protein [Chthoniobacterales bacterium]